MGSNLTQKSIEALQLSNKKERGAMSTVGSHMAVKLNKNLGKNGTK